MPPPSDPPILNPFPPDLAHGFAFSAPSCTCLAGKLLRVRLEASIGCVRYGVLPDSTTVLPLLPPRSAVSCVLCVWWTRSTRSLRPVEPLAPSLRVWPLRSQSLHCITLSGQSSPLDVPKCAWFCHCLVFIDGMLWSLSRHCLLFLGKSLPSSAPFSARYCARYGVWIMLDVFARSSALCVFFSNFFLLYGHINCFQDPQ